MSDPTQRILSALDAHGCAPRRSGRGWSARCPAHEDRRASLSVGPADHGGVVVHCHAGCPTDAVVRALGLSMRDLMPEGPSQSNGRPPARAGDGQVFRDAQAAQRALEAKLGPVAGRWEYHDAGGNPVGVVCRWNLPDGSKTIRPLAKHLDGWRIGAMPEPRPVYRLPEILAADSNEPIIIVEGEKCADAARRCRLLATTSAGGAKAAGKTDWTPLRGRRVVILPDNDSAGEAYALDVAKLTTAAGAADVRILRLADYAPELPDGGDLADVLDSPTWCGLHLAEGAGPEDVGRWILATAERIEPWGLEPAEPALTWEPFPGAVLPEPIRGFVREASDSIGCDPVMVALPTLAMLARCVGNRRAIQLKRDWIEPAIIWGGLIVPSGSHKTPAFDLALRPLRDLQAVARCQYQAEVATYEQEKLRHDKAMSSWRRERGDALPPAAPEPPKPPRFIIGDCTIEALVSCLADGPDGVLVHRDELSGWINGLAEYKGGQGSDLGHWLSCWSATPLSVERKTGENRSVYIPRPLVSLIGGLQPAVFARLLAHEHLHDGLCARFLWAKPPDRPIRWSEREVSPATRGAMDRLVAALLALAGDTDERGEPTPKLLPLGPEAKRLWIDYYNRHRAAMVDLDDDLRSAAAKLEAYAARLALIVHCVRIVAGHADDSAIDGVSIRAGIELSDWFLREAERVYGLFHESDEDRERDALVGWIERHGGAVTVRDLLRGLWRFRGKSDEAEAALNGLAEAGYGQWEDVPADNRGGRPKRVFRLIDAHRHRRNPENARESGGFVDVDVVDESTATPPKPEPVNLMPPKSAGSLGGAA